MKSISILIIAAVLIASCGSANLTKISTETILLPVNSPTQTIKTTKTTSPTNTATSISSTTPTKLPTLIKTPYPIPVGVMTRDELQQQVNDWINGKTILSNVDRILDEKTAAPLRLGILDKPVMGEVIFVYYNLGFTIIEDSQGTPFLLNVVGFEDGKGQRFAFPFHNGRLFNTDEAIIISELKCLGINENEQLFFDQLPPLQFLKNSQDLVGYVNLGTTTIGSDGRGNEGDTFMQSSKETTDDLTNFLDCSSCSLKNIPESLEKYINQIPERFKPDLPYIWIYTRCLQ